jgi:hypothetical protein
VPASGTRSLCGQQFGSGPARVGQLVEFWVACNLIHLSIGGTRVKTVRSHLTVADLAHLKLAEIAPAGSPGQAWHIAHPASGTDETVAAPAGTRLWVRVCYFGNPRSL